MVYDIARGVTVVIEPGSIWEWDGGQWTRRNGPQFGGLPSLAYDANRGVTVALAWLAVPPYTRQLWEWNGTTWSQPVPIGLQLPAFSNFDAGMTYDPLRRVVVLAVPNGTWEWNGTSWEDRAPGGLAPFGERMRASYDVFRGRLVVAARWTEDAGEGIFRDDLWEWDGSSWLYLPDSAKGTSALAYDPVGHVTVSWKDNELWKWNGTSWSLATSSAPLPANTTGHIGMAYDSARSRMVLYRGNNGDAHDDTAEWNGTAFTLFPADYDLMSRAGHAMAFDADRGVSVLFGGARTGSSSPSPVDYLTDTMELDGETWISRTIPGPSGREGHGMAYDIVRGVTVLFGGAQGVGREVPLGDTWEFNGTTWTQVSTAGPSPRLGAAMTYDSARGVIVLFGGLEFHGWPGSSFLGDTWEWNGSSWSLRSSSGPSPRSGTGIMAFDAARGVSTLFGGWTNTPEPRVDGETWEWDGVTWTPRPASGPLPSNSHILGYDTVRERVVMFNNGFSRKVWNWDGNTWSLEGVSAPEPLGQAVFDTIRNRFVLHNGSLFVPTRSYGGPCPVSNPDGQKPRFLSVVIPDADHGGPSGGSAIRVTMVGLQHPDPPNFPSHPAPDFSAYESGPTCTDPAGCARWVGPPRIYSEGSGSGGIFHAARVQCSPYYHDWGGLGLVHVSGAEVVPSSEYDVEVLSSTCLGTEDTCVEVLPAVRLTTSRHADVAAPFGAPSVASQPDGLDVAAVLAKFKGMPNAGTKPSGKLQPNLVELLLEVDGLDISATIDAFKGLAYPFSGPCPCPSTVNCSTAPYCSTSSTCGGGVCVFVCYAGGANVGQPCQSTADCAGGTCGAGQCRDRCGRCSP